MIFPIYPEHIEGVWPVAGPELQRAFQLSEQEDADNHLPALLFDQEQLWKIHETGWALTRVVSTKSGWVLEIIAIAGMGLEQWGDEFFAQIEGWAKSKGCTKVIATGRPGWERRAPGYKAQRITFVKEL